MNISPPVAGGTIQIYKYESFNYLITPTAPADFLTVVNSPEIPLSTLSNINNDAIQFSANPYTGITSANSNSITVTAYDSMSNVLERSTFPVALNPARFFPPGNNVNYTFYRNEPITPITFTTPLTMDLSKYPVVSAPSIPVGLKFIQTASSSFQLAGTPIIQSVSSNYKVIGTDISGRTITSTIGIAVNPERVILDVSGPTTIPMDIGSNMTPVTITARFPPYPLTGGNLQYTWTPALPGGSFVFRNSLGNPIYQPFVPIDTSSTITLTGSIDSNAIQTLATAGIKNYPVTLTGTRISTPNITQSTTFNFTLGELVLFNASNLPSIYVGVPTSNNVYVQAKTYLATFDTSIISMSNLDPLPSGLTGVFDSNRARFYLNGTPTTTSYTPFRIRATNGNGVLRDTTISNLSIISDSVNFNYSITPAIDTCYNFIQYRPLTNGKTGWYPSSILFRASSGAGCNVTMYSPELAFRSDLTLTSVGSNLYQLLGSPETAQSLSTMNIVAVSLDTDVSSSTRIKFSTSAEQYFFTSNSLSGIQNVAIAPLQLSATTLSERPVVNYSSSNLPTGITLSTIGLLTGTSVNYGSGTFTYTASTGYSSSNATINYNFIQDNILIAMAKGSETISTTFSGVDVRGITYSGANAIMSLSNIIPYQAPTQIDLSMGPTGLMSGNLTNVQNLFPRYGFTLSATAGTLSDVKQGLLTISNYPTPRHMALDTGTLSPPTYDPLIPPRADVNLYINSGYIMGISSLGTLSSNLLSNWSVANTPSNLSNTDYGNLCDFTQSSNTIVLVAGPSIYRSPDKGSTWSQNFNITKVSNITGPVYNSSNIYPDPIYGNVATDGSGTYVAIGVGYDKLYNFSNMIRVSSNDGVNWQDYKLTSFLTSNALLNSRMYYNNGRYFITNTSNVFYSSSPTTSWTSSNLLSNVSALAFSNNTIIAVGSNGGINASISSNNGTTWSTLSTTMDGVGVDIEDIVYNDGHWVASAKTSGFSRKYYSTDTTTWTDITNTTIPNTTPTRITFDGNAWNFASSTFSGGARLEPSCNVDLGYIAGIPFNNVRKFSFTTLSNGIPSGTITIPYDPSGYFFVDPPQSSYSFYQYCPIQKIPVEISPSTSNFVYYYASGLPQGLTFLRDSSGIRADISGISTKFSEAYSNVALFAVIPAEGYTIPRVVPMQTIIPRIIHPQDGASSYTSLVRQYVEVNSAQNARDNVVYPSREQALGEFMSPDAPDAVSDKLPCNC